jgi:hypothetical protein
VRKYLRQLETELYAFAIQSNAVVSPLTINISSNGIGEVYLPSRSTFEKIEPQSQPVGLVFVDGSFLVFQEIVRFGYQDESATEAVIYRLKYSYHYQRPTDYFFFRYDYHPDVGHPDTHPPHHLHCAGWLPGSEQFQSVPRFEVNETTLAKVLRLVLISFPTIIS